MKKNIVALLIFVISIINCYSQDLIPFSYQGKVGYVDQKMHVVISPQYDYGSVFEDGFGVVVQGQKSYAIDAQGNILYSTFSNNMWYLGSHCFFAQGNDASDYDGLYKIIDIDSKKVIADRLREIGWQGPNSEGIFAIYHYDGPVDFNYINDNGDSLFLDAPILGGRPFNQGVAVVLIDTGDWNYIYGIINSEGKVGAKNFAALGDYFSEGLCPAQTLEGKTGYVDRNGQLVFELPLTRTELSLGLGNTPFENGRAIIKSAEHEGYWSIIDNKGNYINEFVDATDCYGFFDGMALIHKYSRDTDQHHYGYVNSDGKIIYDYIFSKAEDFHNGYARVTFNDREAIVDTEGNIYYSSDLMKGHK